MNGQQHGLTEKSLHARPSASSRRRHPSRAGTTWARRNEVRGVQDGALKVCVTQAPEKGKANKAIIEVLAKWLEVRKSQIELISGETASQKKFLVREVKLEDLAGRIHARKLVEKK